MPGLFDDLYDQPSGGLFDDLYDGLFDDLYMDLPGNLRPISGGLPTDQATEEFGLPRRDRKVARGLRGSFAAELDRARSRNKALALRVGTGLLEGATAPETLAGIADKMPWWAAPGPKALAAALPENYREGARERQALAGQGRDLAARHLMEAGAGPLAATLAGEAAENVDLLAGGAASGVKGVRALAKATDFTDVMQAATRGLGETRPRRPPVDDFAELAAASSEIGRAPTSARLKAAKIVDEVDGPTHRLRALDEKGRPIAEFEFFEEADHLRPSVITTGGQGTGLGRQLYREAVERTGKKIGPSMAQTEDGTGFRSRLQETDPDLFEPPPRTAASPAALRGESDPTRDLFLRKYAGGIEEKPPAESWLKRTWDRFYLEAVNKDAPVEEIAELAGRPDLVMLVQRSRGAAEISRGPLFRGTTRLDPVTGNVVRTGEPLQQIVRGLDGDGLKDLDALLMAQRQLELSRRVAHSEAVARTADPALLKPGKAPSLRRRRMPREMVDPAAPPPKRMTHKTRGLTERSPLLKPEAPPLSLLEPPKRPITAALKDVDPAVTREAEDLVAHLRSKLGGRFDDFEMRAIRIRDWVRKSTLDPLREVGLVSEESYERITKANRSYAPFMRIVDEAEGVLRASGASFVKEITGGLSEAKKITSPLEEMVVKSQRVQQWAEQQRVRNALADAIDANPELALSKEVRRAAKGEFATKKTFPAYRDGVAEHYVAPREVLRALDRAGAGTGDASLLMKAVSFPVRMLRAGATLTLEFMARNPLRDQFQAGVVSKYGYIPFHDLAKGLFHISPPGNRLFGLYDDYVDAGSSIASMASVDRPHAASTLRDLAGSGAAGAVKRFFHNWRKEGALYPLQLASAVGEKGTRVGAFARARSKGASSLEAMQEAREITLDFGRAGHSGRIANQLYAFLNAEIQDIDKMARAFKARPTETSVKMLTYVTIPSVANYLYWKDDQSYIDLPEWEKATYVHVKKLENGRFVRFPRPIGMAALLAGYGVQKFLEYASGKDPEALAELGERLASDTPARFVSDFGELAPTALRPATEVASGPGGWDFWRDRPIVPRGLQDLDPAMQSTERTPEILQDLGAATGTSPMKAEHLVRGYTAGIGTSAMQILDHYYKEAKGVVVEREERPELPTDPRDVPLVKGFVSQSPFGFGSAPVNDLYKRAAASEQAHSTHRGLLQTSPRKALEYRTTHPEIEHARALRKAKDRLSALRDRRDKIRTLGHTTPEWRAEMLLKIDQTITHYAHVELQRLGYVE